jgi:hypothetical protein
MFNPLSSPVSLTADLNQAAQGLIDEAMINRGAGWIEAMAEEFPIAHKILMELLYGTPEEILDGLAMMSPDLAPLKRNPHVLEYVGQLQEKLIKGKRK